jgi:hypothetical protein
MTPIVDDSTQVLKVNNSKGFYSFATINNHFINDFFMTGRDDSTLVSLVSYTVVKKHDNYA